MALPNLPQRQSVLEQRHTKVQELPHQRPTTSTPPAAPPIDAAKCTRAAAIADDDGHARAQRRQRHDSLVTPTVTADAAAAAAAAASTEGGRCNSTSTSIAAANGEDMWPKKHFKRLPRGSKPVTFVGEGAANAVFEIKIPQHGPSDHTFKGLLLRVAKGPSPGQPTKYNYLLQQKYYQTAIKPLLGEHTMHQELVILRHSGIIDEINRLLQDLDHTRKLKFRGSFVGQSDWGLLIEDMRPPDLRTSLSLPSSPHPRSILVEFKPKWLSQSRSAPGAAVRCRQCALELQRRLLGEPSSSGVAGKFAPERKPCPLALVDDDAPPEVSSPFRIAPQLAELPDRQQLKESLESIIRDPFLDDLCTQQELLDSTGPLRASADDEQFGVAMTIRDCTCFALIPREQAANGSGQGHGIKIRLGDLDWKDPQTKIQHWRRTEESLIDGGFYTADWILCGGVFYYPPTLCLLEWKPRTAAAPGRPDIIQLIDQSDNVANNDKIPLSNIYTHKVDVGTLRQKLQPFQGAESEPINPHRPAPCLLETHTSAHLEK